MDLTNINDDKALMYLTSFEPRPRRDLSQLFKYAPAGFLNLVDQMLRFNSIDRIDTQQILQDPYFASIRDESLEHQADIPVNFEFESIPNITVEQLRQWFLIEIAKYNSGDDF